MLERLHEHIIEELGQSSRTDTIFIVVAVLFNLIVLAINSLAAGIGVAAADDPSELSSRAADLILAIFVLMTLLVNGLAVVGLGVGRRTRGTLLGGLIGMYRDNQVAKYYDPALIANYGARYTLFGGVILLLGVTAIVVPLVIRLL